MITNSLEYIAYQVVEELRANRIDDSDIELSLIKENINSLRAMFLEQYFTGVRSIEQIFVQDLGVVPIEKIDPIEDNNFDTDDYLFRTTNKLPQPIHLRGNMMFTRIGPINKIKVNFDYINYSEVPYASFERFTSNLVKSFYKNNYLYFFTNNKCLDKLKLVENVNVQGIFVNPKEASEFNDATCDFDTEVVYPISSKMKEDIIKYTVQKMLQKLSVGEDKINDGDSLMLNNNADK